MVAPNPRVFPGADHSQIKLGSYLSLLLAGGNRPRQIISSISAQIDGCTRCGKKKIVTRPARDELHLRRSLTVVLLKRQRQFAVIVSDLILGELRTRRLSQS